MELYDQVRSLVNRCDILDNSPLHYATEKWPTDMVRLLLQNGANIGIKNCWDEIPISRIPPDVMEQFLDEDCLVAEGDVFNKDLAITFRYDFLAPDPASLPDHFKPAPQEPEECQLLPPIDDQHKRKEKKAVVKHPLP